MGTRPRWVKYQWNQPGPGLGLFIIRNWAEVLRNWRIMLKLCRRFHIVLITLVAAVLCSEVPCVLKCPHRGGQARRLRVSSSTSSTRHQQETQACIRYSFGPTIPWLPEQYHTRNFGQDFASLEVASNCKSKLAGTRASPVVLSKIGWRKVKICGFGSGKIVLAQHNCILWGVAGTRHCNTLDLQRKRV